MDDSQKELTHLLNKKALPVQNNGSLHVFSKCGVSYAENSKRDYKNQLLSNWKDRK